MVYVYDSLKDKFAQVGVFSNGEEVTRRYFNYFEKGRDYMFFPFVALERRAKDLRAMGLEVVINFD
jgi:hypothetical protein